MRVSRLLTIAALTLAVSSFGCKKKDKDKKADKPATTKTDTKATPKADDKSKTPDAAGKIAINVSKKGYTPDSIEAKGGQDLTLVFTRTEETECGRYVKVSGKGETATELPLNKPVEVKVKVPQDGELKFTCGMDMMTGVITVAKK